MNEENKEQERFPNEEELKKLGFPDDIIKEALSQINDIESDEDQTPEPRTFDEIYRKIIQKKKGRLAAIDVTYDQLDALGEDLRFAPIFDLLRRIWVGRKRSRAKKTRIGTLEVYFGKDGNLHLDFHTRFSWDNMQDEKKELMARLGPETTRGEAEEE